MMGHATSSILLWLLNKSTLKVINSQLMETLGPFLKQILEDLDIDQCTNPDSLVQQTLFLKAVRNLAIYRQQNIISQDFGLIKSSLNDELFDMFEFLNRKTEWFLRFKQQNQEGKNQVLEEAKKHFYEELLLSYHKLYSGLNSQLNKFNLSVGPKLLLKLNSQQISFQSQEFQGEEEVQE